MASMVTMAPSMAIMSSRAGMATISLDFSATAICPITSRCRAAKAETIWIGFLEFFFEPERREVLPPMAMTPALTLTNAATQATKGERSSCNHRSREGATPQFLIVSGVGGPNRKNALDSLYARAVSRRK